MGRLPSRSNAKAGALHRPGRRTAEAFVRAMNIQKGTVRHGHPSQSGPRILKQIRFNFLSHSGIYPHMPMVKRLVILIGFAFSALLVHGAGQTEVKLLLSHQSARPGETILAGVRLKMQPLWHTYWQNSGDSGGPTKIEWKLPPGVKAGEIQWPLPEKFTTSPDHEYFTYSFPRRSVYVMSP